MSFVPGDIELLPDGSDAAVPAGEVEVLRARIHNWFSLRKGTYQYDTEAGFNPAFIRAVGTPASRDALLRSEVRRGLLLQPGVRSVGPIRIRATPDRRAIVSAAVVTEYGTFTETVTV